MFDGGCKALRIVDRHEPASHVRSNEIYCSFCRGGDDGQASRHGFQDHIRHSFPVRRKDQGGCGFHPAGNIVASAQQSDRGESPVLVRDRFEVYSKRTVTDQHRP